MNVLPRAVVRVIESFARLPGIGPRTAQRLAFYMTHVPQTELDKFADSVRNIKTGTVLCDLCKIISDQSPCSICSSPVREKSIICVVEQSSDVIALERTGKYKGSYHVLHGSIDPLNNIGPDEIYIVDLLRRIRIQKPRVREIIFATNPNMEGEATAMYIQKQILDLRIQNSEILMTRLAHGLPIGADIEYADERTLSRALEGRREM